MKHAASGSSSEPAEPGTAADIEQHGQQHAEAVGPRGQHRADQRPRSGGHYRLKARQAEERDSRRALAEDAPAVTEEASHGLLQRLRPYHVRREPRRQRRYEADEVE